MLQPMLFIQAALSIVKVAILNPIILSVILIIIVIGREQIMYCETNQTIFVNCGVYTFANCSMSSEILENCSIISIFYLNFLFEIIF